MTGKMWDVESSFLQIATSTRLGPEESGNSNAGNTVIRTIIIRSAMIDDSVSSETLAPKQILDFSCVEAIYYGDFFL
jgi:hypothetical protein